MHPESLHLGDQLFYLIDQTRLRAQAIQAVAITPLGVVFRVVLSSSAFFGFRLKPDQPSRPSTLSRSRFTSSKASRTAG